MRRGHGVVETEVITVVEILEGVIKVKEAKVLAVVGILKEVVEQVSKKYLPAYSLWLVQPSVDFCWDLQVATNNCSSSGFLFMTIPR